MSFARAMNQFRHTLFDPRPDCNSITKDMMDRVTLGAWPKSADGVAHIAYSFFSENAIRNETVFIPPPVQPNNPEHAQTVRQVVRFALDYWQKLSDNVISFEEKPTLNLTDPGINFYLADPSELANNGAVAMSNMTFANGQMKQALVFYPSSEGYWNYFKNVFSQEDISKFSRSEDLNCAAIFHEIGHALGFSIEGYNFAEAQPINEAIQKTPYGMYCSVMLQQWYAGSVTSICFISNCDHGFTVFPGSLDKALLKNQYDSSHLYPIQNTYSHELLAYNASVPAAYQFLKTLLAHLTFHAEKPVIPQKIALLIPDVLCIGFYAYLGTPWVANAAFVTLTLPKYLPETLLNNAPRLKFILNHAGVGLLVSDILIGVASTATYDPWKTATNLATSVGVGIAGSLAGALSGKCVAATINYLGHTVAKCIKPSTLLLPVTEPAATQEATTPLLEDNVVKKSNSWATFWQSLQHHKSAIDAGSSLRETDVATLHAIIRRKYE